MAVRVLIVDDYTMPRIVFEQVIAGNKRFELAASLPSAEQAVAFCEENPVDLILMDIVMINGISGLEASRRIKEKHPEIKIILVTSMPEVTFLRRAREIGIESFWYKEVQERPILEVMNRTMDGESVYPETTPETMLGNIKSTELTPRELDVLRELTGGLTNQEIAQKMNVSVQAVKMHVTNMLQKTGFQSRLELALHARIEGIVIKE